LAIMTLAGCSISFSDELQHLPPSRIRMMQQCLPPGTGSARMRPVDLFDRDVPSVWHLHCKNDAAEWEIVGLFNFEETPQARAVDFAALRLDAAAPHAVFEFWEERFHGLHKASFTMTLPPHSSRILSIRAATGAPQVIGTDMHVLQGVHELSAETWNPAGATLSAHCRRAPSMRGRVFVYVPDGFAPKFDFPLRNESAHLTHIEGPLWTRELEFGDSSELSWTVPFTPPK
jgi:hypothetical protein